MLLTLACKIQAVQLNYHITINNPSSSRANIELIINGISSNSFQIKDILGPAGFGINVISWNATDIYGNQLSTNFMAGNKNQWEHDVWEINCSNLDTFRFQYTIQPKIVTPPTNHGNPSYWGYIANDYAVFLGAYLFLMPQDPGLVDSVNVSFDMPANWKVITPWPEANNIYIPSQIKTPDFYFLMGSSVLGMGHFDIYSKYIGSTKMVIAAYQYWPGTHKNTLRNNVWGISNYQSILWGSTYNQPYVSIFFPHIVDKPVQHGAGILGTLYSLSENGNSGVTNWFAYASEFAENRYTTYDLGFTDANHCTWFLSGGANFVAIKSLLNTFLYKDIDKHILDQHAAYMKYYVQPGIDIPVASLNSQTVANYDHDISRTKGELVTYLIAKEIYLKTGGKYCFDDLCRLLFNKYWGTGYRINEKDLKSTMEELTGLSFTDFFQKYIYGTEVITFNWEYLDSDGDGLWNLGEICWGTNPNKADTDNDGVNDYDEILANSMPVDYITKKDENKGFPGVFLLLLLKE